MAVTTDSKSKSVAGDLDPAVYFRSADAALLLDAQLLQCKSQQVLPLLSRQTLTGKAQ
jgi:hypothetical protein